MFRIAALFAVLAVAAAAPAPGLVAAPGLVSPLGLSAPLLTPGLSATLLPRVAVAPAQTTLVRQSVVVDHPTPVLRTVPVPVRAVSYAAPQVITPQILAAPSLVGNPWAGQAIVSPWAGQTIVGSPLGAPLLLK